MSGDLPTFSPETRDRLALLRRELADAARILSHERLSQGYGHISARLDDESYFLITPGRHLDDIDPSEIELVQLDGEPLTHRSAEGPPAETHLHAAVYRRRPDVGAVVRAHPEYLQAFGIARVAVRPTHNFGAVLGETTALYDDVRSIYSKERAETVARTLGQARAVVLRGNGCLVIGSGIRTVTVATVWLEESARLQYRALVVAASEGRHGEIAFLSEAEIHEVGAALGTPERVERRWKSLSWAAIRTPGEPTSRSGPQRP